LAQADQRPSPEGLEHTFHSVEDALDFLENEWPTRTGRYRGRAIELCRTALNRIGPLEAAREAMISACLEADMPLTGRRLSSPKIASRLPRIA
jgi:hypothetical protein